MADFCDVSSWLVLKHESFKGAVTESELDGYKMILWTTCAFIISLYNKAKAVLPRQNITILQVDNAQIK